jgi:hypothetical protein
VGWHKKIWGRFFEKDFRAYRKIRTYGKKCA